MWIGENLDDSKKGIAKLASGWTPCRVMKVKKLYSDPIRTVPDHCSFARFRKRHAEAMKDLFCQYVKVLEAEGETDHEVCFVDGTKLENRAGRYTFVWRGSTEKHLAKVKAAV